MASLLAAVGGGMLCCGGLRPRKACMLNNEKVGTSPSGAKTHTEDYAAILRECLIWVPVQHYVAVARNVCLPLPVGLLVVSSRM